MSFLLHARLLQDCHVLGKLQLCHVLLMDNAAVPWFLLVPETSEVEIFDLSINTQQQLQIEVRALGNFVRAEYAVDKLNVAAIGNIVRQLHIHVIGRSMDDYCWPDVVWGRPAPTNYDAEAVAAVIAKLTNKMEYFVA